MTLSMKFAILDTGADNFEEARDLPLGDVEFGKLQIFELRTGHFRQRFC